jgi:cytochrome c peroxidase
MKKSTLRLSLPAFACVIGSLAFPFLIRAQSPVFTPDVNIDQTQLLAGKYPLRKVLESGGQFFTTPFIPADGMGEGVNGPRSKQRAAMYPANPKFPFLRVNGLDSQSCYECHNTIGSYREPGTLSNALIRKPGTVSGSGGFNSDAFINPDFPTPLTELVRNPPHVFGTGYTQQLASEMTFELQLLLQEAHAAAKANPGVAQSQKLMAKSTDFGVLSTTYSSATNSFNDDFSGVIGVATDLVVRPFQWKGIASSVRHFVRDALDFHFSMQAVEKVGAKDCDTDNVFNEVSIGNLSAIVSFVAMTRPPVQEIPPGQAKQVNLGAQLFQGKGSPRIASGMLCATCHTPSLKLDNAVLTIENPPAVDPNAPCPQEVNSKSPSLIDPLGKTEDLPVIHLFNFYQGKVRAAASKQASSSETSHTTALAALKTAIKAPLSGTDAYQINLTNPGNNVLTYTQPRLPAAPDGSVMVPLFSDLRTHNMGDGLKDPVAQGTDAAGISVAPPLFLTRPLWGVADTGPWLHDGRARTLVEAIQLHSGPNSEANPVIDTFNQLNPDEQNAIVAFLLSLRLPLDPGVKAHN